MKTIKQNYTIKSTLSNVWRALVSPEYIDEWGGGSSDMSEEKGADFSLWGGSIWGTNKEVIKEKKLVQEWFSESKHRKWDQPSIVTFELSQVKETIHIVLIHENVPDSDAKSIEEGWDEYYLGPLKKYVEKKSI